MAIIEIEMYSVECDNCKNVYSDEFSAWGDSGIAEENATDSDWFRGEDNTEYEGKHYCDACYSIGDNDEIVICEERRGIFEPVPDEDRNYISNYHLIRTNTELKQPESNKEIGIVRVGKWFREIGYYDADFNEWYIKGKVDSVYIKPEDIRFWFHLKQD
ncbi:hypothetical protein [Chryseobacterium sp.]|uniref:hypothetical protein n=1 Tax=Chryseobacterium sp. TaxID=1871047 RepID=UPI00321A9622